MPWASCSVIQRPSPAAHGDPAQGGPRQLLAFLQLLDPDAYADIKSIREAMNQRRAPFYLRRTKEAMYYFPERQSDGTWVARKIFTKRIPPLLTFRLMDLMSAL